MNLNMSQEKIATLSELGSEAAQELNRRFVADAPVPPYNTHMGWENHMWIRLRSLIGILEEALPALEAALTNPSPADPSYLA